MIVVKIKIERYKFISGLRSLINDWGFTKLLIIEHGIVNKH